MSWYVAWYMLFDRDPLAIVYLTCHLEPWFYVIYKWISLLRLHYLEHLWHNIYDISTIRCVTRGLVNISDMSPISTIRHDISSSAVATASDILNIDHNKNYNLTWLVMNKTSKLKFIKSNPIQSMISKCNYQNH